MRDETSPSSTAGPRTVRQVAGRTLGLQLRFVEAQRPDDFEQAFSAMREAGADQVIDSLDQLPRLAVELVRLRVDVILASASSAAMAAKRATASVPIVFAGVYAPVEIGLVPSLGHPGGNITGVAINAADMAGKRLQLLKEQLVPALKRAAMLTHRRIRPTRCSFRGRRPQSAHWACSSRWCRWEA